MQFPCPNLSELASRGEMRDSCDRGDRRIYLNLGLIGLSPLTGLIMATFWRVRASLFRDFEWGRYRLGFLAAVVLSNWTEAAVRAFHPSWFVFYIIPMNYPRTHLATAQSSPSIARSEEHKKLAYAEGET